MVLVPRTTHACAPALDFVLERTYPAADAIDVPLDADLILIGQGELNAWVTVRVSKGNKLVAGTLYKPEAGRYSWNPDDPLVAGGVYDVHIEVDPGMDPPAAVHDFSFTAGPTVAPEPESPTVTKFAVELYEQELRECVVEADPDSCKDCEEWKVIGVEQRQRLVIDVEHPVGGYGDFDGFRGSHVDYSHDEFGFEGPGSTVYQGPDGGPTHHIIDLGPAESAWSNVCVSVHGFDPVDGYITILYEPSCISTVVEEDTDTAPTTTGGDDSSDSSDPSSGDPSGGDASSSGSGDSSSSSSGDPSSSSGDPGDGPGIDDDAGCGCRSTDAPKGSLMLTLLALGLVRPRRRTVAP